MKIRQLYKIAFILLSAVLLLTSCNSAAPADETAAPVDEVTETALTVTQDFYVIRSDTARDEDVTAAVNVRKAVEAAMDISMGITTDWEKNPVYEHEIIVGETLREETENHAINRTDLGKTGYVIQEVNGKIYIAGGTPEGTILGAQYFIDHFVTGSVIAVPVGYEYIAYHQYDIPNLYIEMNSTKNYKISCTGDSEDTHKAAEVLKYTLYEKAGISLDIEYNATAGAKSAFVLLTEPLEQSGIISVTTEDGNLVFGNSQKNGLYSCVQAFLSTYIYNAQGSYNFGEDFEYIDMSDYIVIDY